MSISDSAFKCLLKPCKFLNINESKSIGYVDGFSWSMWKKQLEIVRFKKSLVWKVCHEMSLSYGLADGQQPDAP